MALCCVRVRAMSTPPSCKLDALLPPPTALTAPSINDVDPPLPFLTELIALASPGPPLRVASCCECLTAMAQLELDPASPSVRSPAALERTDNAEDSVLQFEMSTDSEPPSDEGPVVMPLPPPFSLPLPSASLLHIWADSEGPAARAYPHARGLLTSNLRSRLDANDAELSILRDHVEEVAATQTELKELVERIGGALVALELRVQDSAPQTAARTHGRARGRGGSGSRGWRGKGRGRGREPGGDDAFPPL